MKKSATKKGYFNICRHRMRRIIALDDERAWFMTKREYRHIWKDYGWYPRWNSYSRYLAYKRAHYQMNHYYVFKHSHRKNG